jgi:molybdate transport system substrate-binding protein
MKNVWKWCFFLLLTNMLTAGEIRIAVAANVSYAIGDLKEAFYKSHPDTKIQVILGSSGKLTAQIRHGAPFGLFMSANMKYPKALYEEKMAVTKPVVYAEGTLAILSVKARNYCAEIFVLKDPSIQKIAIANPKTAPYGVAAKEALDNAKLYKKLESKFVYGESISQTVTYAMMAADIGIVAKSSLFSPQMSQYKEAIHWTEVDESLYAPIEQGMVILKEAQGNAEVKAFYDFMLSNEAKVILKKFGYKVK